MTKKKFTEGMTALQEYFNHQMSDKIYALYWESLKHLDEKQWNAACKFMLQEWEPYGRKFPLIKDFKKSVGENTSSKSHLAIGRVKDAAIKWGPYESIDFGDVALHRTVAAFGGWVDICLWTKKEWDINHGRFIEVYEAESHSPDGPKIPYLTGEHARGNGGARPPIRLAKNGQQLKLSQDDSNWNKKERISK